MEPVTSELPAITIDLNARGDWEIQLPDANVTCESLDAAIRQALVLVARRHPAELVIRDAYHRVLERRLVD
jgi:hypothetical protein